MKNKLNLYLLLIAIFFSSNVMAERVLIDGIYYDINKKDATASVSYRSYDKNGKYISQKYNYSSKYGGDIVIPASFTYKDVSYSVTGIDSYAFANCSGITSVTIPDGLTDIGEYVFAVCI